MKLRLFAIAFITLFICLFCISYFLVRNTADCIFYNSQLGCTNQQYTSFELYRTGQKTLAESLVYTAQHPLDLITWIWQPEVFRADN